MLPWLVIVPLTHPTGVPNEAADFLLRRSESLCAIKLRPTRAAQAIDPIGCLATRRGRRVDRIRLAPAPFPPSPKISCIDFRNDLKGLARWYDTATIWRIL
jgi:hypothetical protein